MSTWRRRTRILSAVALAAALAACSGPVARGEIEQGEHRRSAEFAADYAALYDCFSAGQRPSGLIDGRGFARVLDPAAGAAEYKHGFEDRYYTLVRFRRTAAGRAEVTAHATGAAALDRLWTQITECAGGGSD